MCIRDSFHAIKGYRHSYGKKINVIQIVILRLVIAVAVFSRIKVVIDRTRPESGQADIFIKFVVADNSSCLLYTSRCV